MTKSILLFLTLLFAGLTSAVTMRAADADVPPEIAFAKLTDEILSDEFALRSR